MSTLMAERKRPLENDDGQGALFGGDEFAVERPWDRPADAPTFEARVEHPDVADPEVRTEHDRPAASAPADAHGLTEVPPRDLPASSEPALRDLAASSEPALRDLAAPTEPALRDLAAPTEPAPHDLAAPTESTPRDLAAPIEPAPGDLAAPTEPTPRDPAANAPTEVPPHDAATPTEVPSHQELVAGEELGELERAASGAHSPRAPLAGPTLDDVMSRVWEGLVTGLPAACPICHGEVLPSMQGPLHGRCNSCGTTID